VTSSSRRTSAVAACALAALTTLATACAPDPVVLRAAVGEPGDPDAYTMSLVDADGERVETLPAGRYDVVVQDHSAIHNLHLRGPGVEESTGVTQAGTTTWSVTLRPGEHTYVCYPHPGMTARFTVT
jgi:plastocyanin